MWHFIVNEDPRDPYSFKDLTKFRKERRHFFSSLCVIQDDIDYSLFHYIVEVDIPKEAWNILKEVFSEDEPAIEECDFANHAKHQESHTKVEDSQEDFDYQAASDHVITTKVVDPVVLADDNKPVNVVVPSDVSDSRAVARSWFHFFVPLRKSETYFRSANQKRICIIDGTFGITRAQTQG